MASTTDFEEAFPSDTGQSGLHPRDALIAAIRAVRKGMSDGELELRYGLYAAEKSRELWRGMHLKQWTARSEAMLVLSHEMQDAESKPMDRIMAADKLLSAIDRHQAAQEKIDTSLLGDRELRERAIEEQRRPSAAMAEVIIEAWSDPKEAIVEDILEKVLPHWEEKLRAKGWVRQ